MTKAKKTVALIICIVTILSLCVSVYAESDNKIKGETNYKIKKLQHKGVNVEVIDSDSTVNKEEILAQLSDTIMRINQPYSFDHSALSETNSNVKVISKGTITAESIITPHKLKVSGGYTEGQLLGSDPFYADIIVLRQKYKFSGIGVSVSWPAGISADSSDSEDEWVSAEYKDTWWAKAYREDVSGTCLVSLFSVEVTDATDIYVNNVCHKAKASIKKGIWDFSF